MDRSTILPAEINVSESYDFWAAFMPLLIQIFEFDAKWRYSRNLTRWQSGLYGILRGLAQLSRGPVASGSCSDCFRCNMLQPWSAVVQIQLLQSSWKILADGIWFPLPLKVSYTFPWDSSMVSVVHARPLRCAGSEARPSAASPKARTSRPPAAMATGKSRWSWSYGIANLGALW